MARLSRRKKRNKGGEIPLLFFSFEWVCSFAYLFQKEEKGNLLNGEFSFYPESILVDGVWAKSGMVWVTPKDKKYTFLQVKEVVRP